MIRWKDEYSVGIAEMDQEHKKLIAMISSLHDAMTAGMGRAALSAVSLEMLDYARTHFADEEQLMKSCGFPGLAPHRSEHELFIAKTLDIRERIQRGELVFSIEVLSFLKNWLVNHIQRMDKQYGSFIRENAG